MQKGKLSNFYDFKNIEKTVNKIYVFTCTFFNDILCEHFFVFF